MSDYKDRVAGRGLYDEKFYESLREVKKQLERHEKESSKSSSTQQPTTGEARSSDGQRNNPGQPARPQPAQPIWPPPRPLRGGNASQSTASNVVDLRPALELFIDPSWQPVWDGTFHWCDWPECTRRFANLDTMRRHRATHDRDLYMRGEMSLPSYPQPGQSQPASTTAGHQISLPLR